MRKVIHSIGMHCQVLKLFSVKESLWFKVCDKNVERAYTPVPSSGKGKYEYRQFFWHKRIWKLK